MTKFFHKERLAFCLDLVPAKDNKSYNFRTNIPKEFFTKHDALIKEVHIQHLKKRMSKELYIEKIGNIILHFDAESFYFPDELLSPNGKEIYSGIYEKLLKYGGGFKLIHNTFFSGNTKEIQFHILQRKWYILKLFYQEKFNSGIHACSRAKFEEQIISEKCQDDYLEIFASDNEFFVSKEDEATIVYIMTSQEIPVLFIISENV